MMKTNKIYYGWAIVFSAFITLGVVFGLWYSFSVFLLAIKQEFSWSTSTVSSIFSVFLISHSVFGLATGYLQDRLGPRIVIPIGAVFLSFSLVLTSRSESLWDFQIAYGIFAGSGTSMMGYISHSAFLPRWFEKKRGLAVGIATAGIGLGMLAIVPLSERIIFLYGWRNAYLLFGIVILIIIGPLNLVIGRKSPNEVGQFMGEEAADKKSKKHSTTFRVMKVVDEKWAAIEWDVMSAVRTSRFWYLLFSFFFISFCVQGVMLHAVSAMVDCNVDQLKAAYYLGIAGITGSAGKIIFGYCSDIIGREYSKLISDCIAVLGIIVLIHVSFNPEILGITYALLFGLGYGAAAPLIPTISADIFMGNKFGMIFSIIALGGGIGGATGTYVSGLLRDFTKNYSMSLWVCCLALAISCALVFLAAPGKVRKCVLTVSPSAIR